MAFMHYTGNAVVHRETANRPHWHDLICRLIKIYIIFNNFSFFIWRGQTKIWEARPPIALRGYGPQNIVILQNLTCPGAVLWLLNIASSTSWKYYIKSTPTLSPRLRVWETWCDITDRVNSCGSDCSTDRELASDQFVTGCYAHAHEWLMMFV